MRTKSYLLFLIIFLSGGFFYTSAQEAASDSVVHRNVTVEREYRPAIQDAGKINIEPQMASPAVKQLTPSYNTGFSKSLDIGYNIHYLPAAEVTRPIMNIKKGYARVGVGSGINTLADFAYPLFSNKDTQLDFILNHHGLFNSKAHSVTQAKLGFTKRFREFDLSLGAGGRHEYFKYYGDFFDADGNSDNSLKDIQNSYYPNNPSIYNPFHALTHLDKATFWRFNANAGINNSPWADELRYAMKINYNYFNAGNSITEHQIKVDGNLDAEINSDNRIGLDLISSSQFYNTELLDYNKLIKNYSVLILNPYFSIQKEAWDLRIGIKSAFSFGKGQILNISPDIHANWRVMPDYVSLYAGIGGGYKINTLSSIYEENRFMQPGTTVKDTYTPVDMYAGIKVSPTYGLLFDVFINYKYIKHQHFFINDSYIASGYPNSASYENDPRIYTNKFTCVYSNTNLFRVGARVSYNYFDKFYAQLSGAYNGWDVDKFEYAWNKPSWEINFNTKFEIFTDFNLYANINLEGGRYALLMNLEPIKMDPAIININIGADYSLYSWMSVFVKVNNLINNKYQPWYGYDAQGFNVMAGVIFDF